MIRPIKQEGMVKERFMTPGAIDVHVHLREPSTNPAETIEGGTRAALMGGFVLVADMPNNPGEPVWNKERLDRKIEIAESNAWIPTGFYAGSQPEADNIGDLEKMAPHAIGLKLYGDPTTGNDNTYEASDFREIVNEWHRVAPGKPIMFHPGRDNLLDMIKLVAMETAHPFHVCHVSGMPQVRLVTEAKLEDLVVSSGVTPHHMLKTSHDTKTEGKFAEMKPPLEDQYTAEQLLQAVEEGEIDVIETDFAPHSLEAKYTAEHEDGNCFGVPGIEHVLPLLFYQVEKGRLSMKRLIDATSTRPAQILGVKFDTRTGVYWNAEGGAYRLSEEDVVSSCGWSPYMGMLAVGRVERVQIAGTPVVVQGIPFRKYPEVIETRGHTVS